MKNENINADAPFIFIYSNQNVIYVSINDFQIGNSKMEIYNMYGQLICSEKFSAISHSHQM